MQTSAAAGGAMYRFLACTVSSEVYDADRKDCDTQDHDARAGSIIRETRLQCLSGGGRRKTLGIVSKFDFLRAFAFTSSPIVPHYDELMGRPVADVMTEAVVHVDPTSPVPRVLQLTVSLKTRSFPVMHSDHQLEGTISREDVMRALKETTQKDRPDGRPPILISRSANSRARHRAADLNRRLVGALNPLSPRRNPAHECARPRTL